MSKYKLIQLTNSNFTNIAADAYIPFGNVTRSINTCCDACSPFTVTTTASDILYINEPGYYKVTYNGSLAANAAGVVGVSLMTNGTSVYTTSETAAAAEDLINLSFSYVIRVCPNCCSAPYNCPVSVQIQLGDTALSATTPSTANLIIERVF